MPLAQGTENDIDFSKSVNGVAWEIGEYDERTVLTIMQKHELSEIVSRLLAIKGIEPDQVESYLNPTIKDFLPDPSHLLDMDKAAERLAQAVINNENVVVFGDYDVDGATSSALLHRFFNKVGLSIGIYIPDRIVEGYGPNVEAFKKLCAAGANVIVTVDCGTVSYQPIEEANKANVDTIIIDHHLGAEKLPDAHAVVNPNRIDEASPLKDVAAVGICFLLAVAVNRVLREKGWFKDRQEPSLLEFLDVVALGTICDVMPITGLNRAFVAQGLKVMSKRGNLGLRSLSDVAEIEEAANTYHAGFILGPRINAGGRIGKADLGSRLLTTSDTDEAYKIALELDRLNIERRTIETLVSDQALIKAEKLPEDTSAIFVSGKKWHEGVIGIVASRLKEKFNKPAIVISVQDGVGKGSIRSVPGVDIGSVITQAKFENLISKGGGHKMAAGFSAPEEKLEELQKFINDSVKEGVAEYISSRKLKIDSLLNLSAVTIELAKDILTIGPFGTGNYEPRFAFTNVKINHSKIVGEKHIMCFLGEAGPFGNPKTKLKAMSFRSVDTELGNFILNNTGKTIHCAGKIKLNSWQGIEKAELFIDDLMLA